ncbi:MAG: hypothetical protein SGILL_006354, partial [Bacillariaceae sp.]
VQGFASLSRLRCNTSPITQERTCRSSAFLSASKNSFATDGVLYRQSVCTKEEMKEIQQEIDQAMKQVSDERSSIAQGRMGATLSQDCEIAKILQQGCIFSLAQRAVSGETNSKLVLAKEIPIEMRIYEKTGASMAWHRDDVLYDPPQLEVVFTVENTSDCVTMWKVGDDLYSQETHPNSLVLLRAGGPEHCVTSLKRGRRVILKCAYTMEGAKFVGEDYQNQFQEARGKKAKGKRKQRAKS